MLEVVQKNFLNQVKILDFALRKVKENDKVLTVDIDQISDFCVKEWKEHGDVRIEKDGKMDL